MNPRAAHHGNTISNRARYDHFDTTPYYSKSAHRTDLDIITVFFAVVNTFLKKTLNYMLKNLSGSTVAPVLVLTTSK